MTQFWKKALKEAALIMVLALALGLGSNRMRADGLGFSLQKPAAHPAGVKVVGLEEALELYRDKGAVFLDARDPDFYELERIRGSLSLPFDGFEGAFPGLKARLGKASIFIAYCDGKDCPLGEKLAAKLVRMGFSGVMVFEGDLDEWRGAGGPLEGKEITR